MKNEFRVVGKSKAGADVVAGIFKLVDTAGMPLAMVLYCLEEKKMAPSWLHFCQEAFAAGWEKKTVLRHISEATEEVCGKEYRDKVMGYLDDQTLLNAARGEYRCSDGMKKLDEAPMYV